MFMCDDQKDVSKLIYHLKIAQGHFSTKTTKAGERTDDLPNNGTRKPREDTVAENVTTKRRGIT